MVHINTLIIFLINIKFHTILNFNYIPGMWILYNVGHTSFISHILSRTIMKITISILIFYYNHIIVDFVRMFNIN